MGFLLRDIRLAFRALFRKPGVPVLAIASLSLAIGFSTAAFSILDAYSLRDLPVREPRDLAWIFAITREQRPDQLSWIEYQALSSRSRFFTGVLAQDRQDPRVRLPERDDFPITSGVSDNFFDLLGVRAAQGDVFHAGRGSDGTVVVSYHYWQTALSADPAIIGRTLAVGDGLLRVIGALPPGFTGTNRGLLVELFVPQQTLFGALKLSRPEATRATDFELLGRLRPGVGLEQARTEINAMLRQVEGEGRAPGPDRKALMEDFAERSLSAKLASNAVLLSVAVLLILIAAANLANLRLVQNEGRRHETGIRLALGAGRTALARQHLAEITVLGSVGLLGGMALAACLIRVAPSIFYGGRSYVNFGVRFDVRTLAFSCGALLLVALVGGLVPLGDAWKRSLIPSLQGVRATHASRWLGVLVIAQMALVTAGACSAGLLLRNLRNLAAIRPAMDPDRALLLVEGYWNSAANGGGRAESLADHMASTPGVERVAWARRALLSGSGGGSIVDVEVSNQPKYAFRYNQVSPSYFEVTGARILGGRAFRSSDGPDATPVVMLSVAFAHRFFGDRPAVGQWIKVNGKDHQVIGIVEDGPTIHLREPVAPYLYFAFAQRPSEHITFFVASRRAAASMTKILRPLIRSADAGFTTLDMTSLRQHMRNAQDEERLSATVAGVLTLVGLLLAAAGLLGVTMYAVTRRTQEFGVRVALGAGPALLAREVLREAGLRIALALPLGWALAYTARHALQSRLYGIAPDDLSTLLVSSAVVAAVAVLAALHPALRAARIDPMLALRHE
jgi:predicted permease